MILFKKNLRELLVFSVSKGAKKPLICSFIMSDLSDWLMATHLF